MKHLFSIILLTLFSSGVVFAQILPPVQPLNNTVGGIAWYDNNPKNGLREVGEAPIPGLLVKLLSGSTVVSTALTELDGSFTINFSPASYPTTYRLEYVFPTAGFGITTQRTGADNSINSAATGPTGGRYFSANFSITSASDNPTNLGLGLLEIANTITRCTTKESTQTVWGGVGALVNLQLPKSSVTPIPDYVLIWGSEAVYHPVAGIENTSTSAPSNYEFEFSGRVGMTLPGNADYPGTSTTPDIQITTLVSKVGDLAIYDGTTDFLGTSGIAYFNQFGFGVNTKEYFTGDIDIESVFTGTGNFVIPTIARGVTSSSGGSNQVSLVSTYAAAGACVVYSYEVGALPVTLTSFTVKAEDKTANLAWTTTEESNSDKFEIQRSADARNWATIGTVKSHGDSKVTVNYTFADNSPVNGKNYYRLKMIDLDGTFAYSRINNVLFKGLASKLSVYPNPVVNELRVNSVSDLAISGLEVFNNVGQVVLKTQKTSLPISVTHLAQGIYSVRVIYTDGSSDKTKVLVSH